MDRWNSKSFLYMCRSAIFNSDYGTDDKYINILIFPH